MIRNGSLLLRNSTFSCVLEASQATRGCGVEAALSGETLAVLFTTQLLVLKATGSMDEAMSEKLTA